MSKPEWTGSPACMKHFFKGHRWWCKKCDLETDRQFKDCAEELWRLKGARNHWDDNGDLVVEERMILRQVGYQGHSGEGRLYARGDSALLTERGGFTPVYVPIAVWKEDDGWKD